MTVSGHWLIIQRHEMIMLVRRIVVISLVVLVLLASGVVVALAASGGESTPISKTQAVAFAKAVNLRASDLPGAKRGELPSYERRQNEREAQVSWAKLVRCARHHLAAHRPIDVGAPVSLLLDGPWIVGDGVRVMRSESVAASEVGAFASKRGHVCFSRADQVSVTSANEPPEKPEPLKTTFLQLGRSLGDAAIGVQTVSNALGSTLYSDVVLFRVGSAEVVFSADGRQPFPAATERRLLSLLYSRAKAHKL
jgi:hypothetical protein